MSTQVGLNTAFNTNLYPYNYYPAAGGTSLMMPAGTSSGIFDNNYLQSSVNNYEDDFLMPDYLKLSNINTNPYAALNRYQEAQTQQVQQQTPAQISRQEQQELINQPQALVDSNQQTFSAQNNNMTLPVQYDTQSIQGSLADLDKNIGITQSGNLYQKSTSFAKYGAIAGLSVPVVRRTLKVLGGAKVSNVFKFKPLAIAAGLLGGIGWCVGKLTDGFVNSKRAQAADSQMYLQNPYNMNV